MHGGSLKLDRKEFLRRYSFTESDFEKSKVEWSALEQISSLHSRDIGELETTAAYISQRLRDVPAVHSLKVRIKHPEHLIAKIIRKRLENPKTTVTPENYKAQITDLIGIRALHLFKGDWRSIHEFVTGTWEIAERPIAYVRQGDSKAIIQTFEESGCTVEPHDMGYRSVHYLIKSQPAKSIHLAELQVRTLFEEGWSEIDHRVRYPRLSDNPHLAEFLTIFNRLAGSADEMGTFIEALSGYLADQGSKLAAAAEKLETKEKELKKAIAQLGITNADKRKLQEQVEGLRRSSPQLTSWSFLDASQYDPQKWTVLGAPNIVSGTTIWSPGVLIGGQERICTNCGQAFKDDSPFLINSLCPKCRGTLPGAAG